MTLEAIQGKVKSEPLNRNFSYMDSQVQSAMSQMGQKVTKGELVINVKDFGAVGDFENDDTQAIQEAMDYGAENNIKVYAPGATYRLTDTLRPPSGVYLFGDGINKTIFKMDEDVPREKSVMVTGSIGDRRENIVLEDFTIDFNQDRWDVFGATTDYHSDSQQSGLVIAATEYCWVRRVTSHWARKHGIDVSGSDNMRGDNDPLTYSPDPSEYVWLEDCIATHAGDDCITTHMCSYVWLTRCIGMDAQAEFASNSNGIEIDDGSRNVWVHDCAAFRCNDGLEIKGHADTPAPYNILCYWYFPGGKLCFRIRYYSYWTQGTK